jgi:hypothetical protein
LSSWSEGFLRKYLVTLCSRRATKIETQKLKKVFGEELLAACEKSKQKNKDKSSTASLLPAIKKCGTRDAIEMKTRKLLLNDKLKSYPI